VNGIRADDYVHAVREDHTRRGLLYAATQHGVYISYDDGTNWESLSLNLPDVPVSDLIVERTDLAIATHGRGFYILDDIDALRQYTPQMSLSTDPVLFRPADAIRSAGGATVRYWLKRPAQSVTIDVLDAKGETVRTFTSATAAAAGRGGAGGGRGAGVAPGGTGVTGAADQGGGGGRGGRGGGGFATVSVAPGMNSVTWDLRYPAAVTFPGMILWGASTAGPTAPPGTYQVRMTVDGRTSTQPLVVMRNPLYTDVTDADLQEQFALSMEIRDKVSEANNAVIRIRAIKRDVADRLTKSQDARLKGAGDRLTASLSAVEEEIYQVRNQSGQDPLNFPIRINNRLASLLGIVSAGDGKPIANAVPIFNDLKAELKVQTDRLAQVIGRDLAAFNTEARRVGVEPVTGS